MRTGGAQSTSRNNAQVGVSVEQGKRKAPTPLHTSPYPYLCTDHSSYLNGIAGDPVRCADVFTAMTCEHM